MTCYLSLGSNLGDREKHIDNACRMIAAQCGSVVARSGNHYSEPWGYRSEHTYLNICIRIETTLTPIELLDVTQQIERELGRTQKNVYADRIIDIDLLFCIAGDGAPVTCRSERLTLPHPLMTQRDFVMVPLHEIADGQTIETYIQNHTQ
ncbi:MAG: 2-amino-4-hydroxy-6-hydroxymethyldihydropteridine diphosphokinase [Paludibacteraceae bacterium]|nr:2-amino-4-hydroxy-6-hydroxymethyldihydropteridine diphosphokinase [Paludibacteraceae bacterium]